MRAFWLVISLVMAQTPPAPIKDRPVSRVINLLKDMHKQLLHEQKVDEETYEKLDCWCKTNEKSKTKAVRIAKEKITSLTNGIQEYAAAKARLESEIKQHKKDFARAKDAMSEARGIREKEAADFYKEHKDYLQSIEMLRNAITVLSKHHRPQEFRQIKTLVRHLLYRHGDLVSVPHRQTLGGFLQMPVYQSYAPQSSEIFGILGTMKETMEKNLGDAKTTEDEAIANYKAFKSAKEEEFAAHTEALSTKNTELADATENLGQSKEDLELTRNALAADVQFLSDLNLKCQSTDHEWEQRQKVRSDEIAAVTEAIGILSEDDAHDTFDKTVNSKPVSLLQTSNRQRAVAYLEKAAAKTRSPALLALASSAQLDAFTKIKAAIDKMVAQLKEEHANEVKERDWCTAEFRQNDRQTTQKNRDKSDLEVTITDLDATLKRLSEEIADHQQEIADNQVSIKTAGETREAQNADFQATVADQRNAQAVLKKAIDRLNVFYAKKASLVQDPVPGAAAPPPPPGFQKYDKNAGAKSVIQLIKNILEESETIVKEAVQSEQEAQAEYETFVKNANSSIDTLKRQVVSKTQASASTEEQKSVAEQDLASTNNDLDVLADYNANLHKSCDFLMKNFTIRQEARTQEIEAMQNAKAVLSGADLE